MSQVAKKNIRLGELLSQSALVTIPDINDALRISVQAGRPLGRVLVEQGKLSEPIVRAAVLAQQLMRDYLLAPDLAVRALQLAAQRNLNLETALTALGWHKGAHPPTNRLGDLLIEAGLVSAGSVRDALEATMASGVPLTRVLLLRQQLTEVAAGAALAAQILLKERKISKIQAVSAIRESVQRNMPVEDWLKQCGALDRKSKAQMRLGELLLASTVITESVLIQAVEYALENELPVGQVLLQMGAVNQEILDLSLALQKQINQGTKSALEGAQELRERLMALNAPPPQPTPQPSRTEENLNYKLQLAGFESGTDPTAAAAQLLRDRDKFMDLAFSQQEKDKTRVSSEIQNGAMSDLLMLKRSIRGLKTMSPEQILQIVDRVIDRLSGVCNDLDPRHLAEVGINQTVREFLDRLDRRTGMKHEFYADKEPPKLMEPISLHIFRIIQEYLTMAAEVQEGTSAVVAIEMVRDNRLKITLSHNGKALPGAADGITDNIRQRAELINLVCPMQISGRVKSRQETLLIMEIKVF